MKTVSGNCVSSKQISLSKAAKILSKFVSADNGASKVTSAYLNRASAAFNELKHIHKELNSPQSRKKRKEIHDDSGNVEVNYVHSVEINLELNNGHQFDNADEDGEKSIQTVAKFSQELNDSNGYDKGIGRIEKHKKNRKKHDVESRRDGDNTMVTEKGKKQTNGENEGRRR